MAWTLGWLLNLAAYKVIGGGRLVIFLVILVFYLGALGGNAFLYF